MMLSNVIVDVTIPRCSFVFGQSRAKASAGFTNIRSLAVAAFDLVYCSLSVLRFVFVNYQPSISNDRQFGIVVFVLPSPQACAVRPMRFGPSEFLRLSDLGYVTEMH